MHNRQLGGGETTLYKPYLKIKISVWELRKSSYQNPVFNYSNSSNWRFYTVSPGWSIQWLTWQRARLSTPLFYVLPFVPVSSFFSLFSLFSCFVLLTNKTTRFFTTWTRVYSTHLIDSPVKEAVDATRESHGIPFQEVELPKGTAVVWLLLFCVSVAGLDADASASHFIKNGLFKKTDKDYLCRASGCWLKWKPISARHLSSFLYFVLFSLLLLRQKRIAYYSRHCELLKIRSRQKRPIFPF